MWRLERIGRWSIAAILGAAAAGLFGHGPLSRATLRLPGTERAGGMMLVYERFGRAFSESQLVISGSAEVPDGETSLWLSGEYLSHVEILRITPDPASQRVEHNGVRYSFRLGDGAQTLTFRVKAQRPGILTTALRLNDGPQASFDQWFFP
jgi:hypothetical protein